MSKLDKALRTADQILQAGGFGVAMLDLASVTLASGLRILSATWCRFSRATQRIGFKFCATFRHSLELHARQLCFADKLRAFQIDLREGMAKNQVGIAAQKMIQSISSFAMYGFPESHAASFALIAYASAWLKFHYLGAFTAAILNNQPIGFYSAAVLVKNAQRHGLRLGPIEVTRSSWPCTLEREEDGSLSFRLGPWLYPRPSRDRRRRA